MFSQGVSVAKKPSNELKKLTLVGKKFVCCTSCHLFLGTLKGIKLEAEQSFRAQSPSRQIRSVSYTNTK